MRTRWTLVALAAATIAVAGDALVGADAGSQRTAAGGAERAGAGSARAAAGGTERAAAAGAGRAAAAGRPPVDASAPRRAGLARGAVVDRATRCEKPAVLANPPRLVPPRFPLRDVNRPNPICRLAQRRTIDVPLSGVARGGRFDPRPPCGNYDPVKRCFPSAFRNGNARVLRERFAPPFIPSDPLIGLYDSFGGSGDSPRSRPPIAYVEQGPYPGCFNIYDFNRTLRGSTDPLTATARCDPANAGRSLATIEFQGRGCMVTRNVERRFVIAGLVQSPGREAALYTGLRGFVPLSAVPVAPGTDRLTGVVPQDTPSVPGGLTGTEFRMLQEAYTGCGRKARPGMAPLAADQRAPADDQLHVADNAAVTAFRQADGSPGWPSSAFPVPDQYLNATTLRSGCRTQSATTPVAGCTGFYANYQGPCYAPGVAGVALSTTYVSATGTTAADNPGNVRSGGVVRAYVRRDAGPGSFQPVDRMLYADNNVPDAQGAVVTWVFGNFNPRAGETNAATAAFGANREQGIWGWTAIRTPRAAVGNHTC